jgi:uncharacterized protein YjlB
VWTAAARRGPHEKARKKGWKAPVSSLARTQEDPGTGTTALWFAADGWVPNNQRLPALLYRQAIPEARDRAAACEAMFDGNGWPPQWRAGIYPFHHYHSTAHEVLGIARGKGRVLLGGPNGLPLEIGAGDCVLLPAGTGHCRLAAGGDFLVVGAYPPGQAWDLRRDALSAAELSAMAQVPFPTTDPVTGCTGGLLDFWPQVP